MTAQTTLQQDYEEVRDRAIRHLVNNQSLKRLTVSLKGNKVKKLHSRSSNVAAVNELAQMGIINVYMDNTYNLSKLGKELVAIFE